ncbi:MAG: hypothetical protein IPL52_01220 [Flavobacteriales bacterium]|nr:hypothetical protein [Flavobacteriales bacterium]
MHSKFLDWFEEHKLGIIGTLTLHTLVLFALTFLHLQTVPREDEISDMRMDVIEPREADAIIERIITGESTEPEKVTNLTSNIAAELRPSFNRERLAERVEEAVAAEAQAEFERLERERAERGETDPEVPELDPSKWNKDLYMEKAAEPARVEGATTVWHDLKDPLRAELHIHVPAYVCKGFGQVVINVVVDRTGQVRKAELDMARTTTVDECMVGNALRSARGAIFAGSMSAPEQHRGSIYYRFMPQ